VEVTGDQASDLEAPTITSVVSGTLATRQVTVAAIDTGTGIKSIWYSLDGVNFALYRGRLTIDARRTATVFVFADDMVGNRSSLFEVVVSHRVFVPAVRR
jgi:hypothetical protein